MHDAIQSTVIPPNGFIPTDMVMGAHFHSLQRNNSPPFACHPTIPQTSIICTLARRPPTGITITRSPSPSYIDSVRPQKRPSGRPSSSLDHKEPSFSRACVPQCSAPCSHIMHYPALTTSARIYSQGRSTSAWTSSSRPGDTP